MEYSICPGGESPPPPLYCSVMAVTLSHQRYQIVECAIEVGKTNGGRLNSNSCQETRDRRHFLHDRPRYSRNCLFIWGTMTGCSSSFKTRKSWGSSLANTNQIIIGRNSIARHLIVRHSKLQHWSWITLASQWPEPLYYSCEVNAPHHHFYSFSFSFSPPYQNPLKSRSSVSSRCCRS